MHLPGFMTRCLCMMILLVSGIHLHHQVCGNLETTKHDNGCAILQYQFGQQVLIHAACGKEIDGNCHLAHEVVTKGNLTYQCRRLQVGNTTELKYHVIRLGRRNCTENGFFHIHLETLRLKINRCEHYQCQNGVSVRVEKSCGRSVDVNCHLVGEVFVKMGNNFICKSLEQNGVSKYKAEGLNPTIGQSCNFENKTYKHLQIFNRQSICGFRQCYNGEVKVLTINCMPKDYPGNCYDIGQILEMGGVAFQCNLDKDNKTAIFEVFNQTYKDCQHSQLVYKHLEIFQDGCNTTQCVDGVSTVIQGGCLWSVNSTCYSLDFVWQHEGTTFKCTRANDGLYQVIEIETQ